MSHVVSISIQIHDLDALEAAVKELNATLIRNQKTYAWYGRHVGDFPLPNGFTKDMLGKCEHAIRLNGHKSNDYEIGVAKNPTGQGYTLLYDFWGPGQKLKTALGDGLGKLVQLYGVHTAEKHARLKGISTTRHKMPNGNIQVKLHLK